MRVQGNCGNQGEITAKTYRRSAELLQEGDVSSRSVLYEKNKLPLQSKNSFQRIINFSHLVSGQFAPNINQSEAMIYRAGLETICYGLLGQTIDSTRQNLHIGIYSAFLFTPCGDGYDLYHRHPFIVNVIRHNDTRPNLACFGALDWIKIDINDETALQSCHSGHPVKAVSVNSGNSASSSYSSAYRFADC